MRRHARKRPGSVHYKHCHYFVRLEEGKPPAHYYAPPKSGEEMLENWMAEMKQRKIIHSL
jgi:large subunit ribosomal protein L22